MSLVEFSLACAVPVSTELPSLPLCGGQGVPTRCRRQNLVSNILEWGSACQHCCWCAHISRLAFCWAWGTMLAEGVCATFVMALEWLWDGRH